MLKQLYSIPETWNNEPARRARKVKVFQITRRREGGGYRFRHHIKFCLNLSVAKWAVENLREQGTWWEIIETPACVFSGTKHKLVIAYSNPLGFGQHSYSSRTHPMLGFIAEAFPEAYHFSCEGKSDEWSSEFFQLQSISRGGGYPLDWRSHRSKSDWDLHSLGRVIAAHRLSMKSCVFLGVIFSRFGKTVMINKLHSKSPLREKGARKGDLITDLRLKPSTFSVEDAFEALKPDEYVELSLLRERHEFTIGVRAPSFLDVFGRGQS
jgi:hypothetical protein